MFSKLWQSVAAILGVLAVAAVLAGRQVPDVG